VIELEHEFGGVGNKIQCVTSTMFLSLSLEVEPDLV
jgi:hypothetical protein